MDKHHTLNSIPLAAQPSQEPLIQQSNSSLLAIAKVIFAGDSYATHATGVEIIEVGAHYARCGLLIKPSHCNARGKVMGGVYGTMADFAFAIAANSECIAQTASANTLQGEALLQWVTTECTMHYLSTPKSLGKDVDSKPIYLTATATMIRHGRTTCLYEVTIAELNSPKPLAHALIGGMKLQ